MNIIIITIGIIITIAFLYWAFVYYNLVIGKFH